MRTVPVEILSDLSNFIDALFGVYLLKLNVDSSSLNASPLCLTNADIDIYYDDGNGMNIYKSWGMDFGAIEYSISPTVDKVSIEIDNISYSMSDLVQNTEVRGKNALLQLAIINNKDLVGTQKTGYDGTTFYDNAGRDLIAWAAKDGMVIRNTTRGTQGVIQSISNGDAVNDSATVVNSTIDFYAGDSIVIESSRHAKVLGTQIMFAGIIDSVPTVKQKYAKFEIYNHMIMWKKKVPRNMHSPSCPWTFKDAATCKYSGNNPKCDKSWKQCATLHGNAINFRGFRWLPALQTRSQIWWGRVAR